MRFGDFISQLSKNKQNAFKYKPKMSFYQPLQRRGIHAETVYRNEQQLTCVIISLFFSVSIYFQII